VTLCAQIAMPPGAGKVVAAEWDFDGSGDFATKVDIGAPAETVTLEASHTFPASGTHFAVLRVSGQREDDADTRFARVQNIARVRVVAAQ